MPLFEFICNDCGAKFEKLVFSIDNETIECPKCKSSNISKQLSVFSASSKSESHGHCHGVSSSDCAAKRHSGCCSGCCGH